MVAMNSKSELESRSPQRPARLGPKRLLMLVPHEPTLDPRIKWVTEMCARHGRTDILCYTNTVDSRPEREYDAVVYVERVNVNDCPLGGVFRLLRFVRRVKGILRLAVWLVWRPSNLANREPDNQSRESESIVRNESTFGPAQSASPDVTSGFRISVGKISRLLWGRYDLSNTSPIFSQLF